MTTCVRPYIYIKTILNVYLIHNTTSFIINCLLKSSYTNINKINIYTIC